MAESKSDGGCGVGGMYFFFVAGGGLVLTSGAGRPRSAPIVPILRSRSRRESAAAADLLAALHVVHDGRGHLLYRVPHLQLLIRCLLLLMLLLLLLRSKHNKLEKGIPPIVRGRTDTKFLRYTPFDGQADVETERSDGSFDGR